MGNLRASFVLLALAPFAACSDNKKAAIDAAIVIADSPADSRADGPTDAPPDAPPNYDFTCLGNTAPTTAPTTLTYGGTAQEVVVNGGTPAIQAAEGATIDTCKGGAANCNGANKLDSTTTTTTMPSTFTTAAIATHDVPLDAYLIASKTGDWSAYMFSDQPAHTNLPDVPVIMFSDAALLALSGFGITQDPGNGMVLLLVTDCAGTRIAGATVTVKQNGVDAGDAPVSGDQLGAQGAGGFVSLNVPPGETEVGASYNGMTFRTHTIKAVAGASSATQVKPGF